MLNNSSKEYFLDTCCSLNLNERIYFSCGLNEKIHLNIIEIYYNSDPYCSEEYSCCKTETVCSRRITKYYNSNCDKKNSCWIDKNCLKIYSPCSNIEGLYGQYITIKYSCLPLIEIINSTDQLPVPPIFFKLFKSEETTKENELIKRKFILISNNWKSSPIFLIILISIFIFAILILYCLADQIGQRICRKRYLKKNNDKTDLISRQIIVEYSANERRDVQTNPSTAITRVYPHQHIRPPYQTYVNLQRDPITGQIYSRTFYNYLDHYY